MEPSTTEFRDLEATLIRETSVLDCAIRRKHRERANAEIIAYIVPLGDFQEHAVRSRLQSAFPASALPDSYVLVSSLPLSQNGALDEEALARLEVVDEQLARACEQQLLSSPEVEQAKVVIEPRLPKLGPLHLADLLGSGPLLRPTREVTRDAAPFADRAAISQGEPFQNPEQVPPILQRALARAAKAKPARGITYVQTDDSEVTHSYQELLEDAERILAGLRSFGLRAGDKVILQLDRNQDFIPAFWGCVLGGFVPAPISIAPTYAELNSTIKKLHHSWELLGHPLILAGQGLAHDVRRIRELLDLEDLRVESVEKLRTFGRDQDWHRSQPDDVCLILLTSGSTGLPKGVLQSHRSLMHRSAGTAQLTHFGATDALLNWFPLDHVGGIVMSHLMALFGSARQIHVPTETILEEPLKWLDLIERHRATATWAPNFAFGLINNQENDLHSRRWDLSSMRFVLNGGEAIVPKTARRFLDLLAKHGLRADAMHPSWGMSETCSGVAFSDRCSVETLRDEDTFVEVGGPIPGISFRIVDGRDQILKEGQVGRLQVKGLPVTTGYYNNRELNRESFSPDGWLNTGDLAVLKDRRLTITGRSKDVIIINGANFFSHEIESVVEEVLGVEASYAAAFAVRGANDNTDRLCIVFHPLAQDWMGQLDAVRRIRETLVTKAGVHAAFVIPVEQADIPKTAIGKIERSTLRRRFESGEFDSIVRRIDLDTESSHTLPNWFFRKTWTVRQPHILDSSQLEARYLVFADSEGLASHLSGKIGARALTWIEVVRGEEFARIDRSHYRLNPAEHSHYELLLTALAQDQIEVDCVLHLWTYGGDLGSSASVHELARAQQYGTLSLLRLTQMLDRANGAHRVKLFVVSSRAQATGEQDRAASEKATLLGLLKTISLEMPLLDCRHVDLEGSSPAADAERLRQELAISRSRTEVAYRREKRLEAALSQVDMLAEPIQPSPIAEGGLYLITGGLGGIGTHLAEYLSREYRTKLVLVGRTILPNTNEEADGIEPDSVLARRLRNRRRLESCSADFLYRSADICDLGRLREVVREAEEHWNRPLAGIFHLAGEGNLERHWKVMDQHWVRVERTGTFEWMFAPKVYGTRTLFELIADRPEALFVAFSSVFSLFGSATSSGYSAASSFLDAYCDERRKTSHPNTFCFNWTVWDDVGMSEAGPAAVGEAFRNMGYALLSSSQALGSMTAALLRKQHQLAIGLDLASPHVQRHTLHPPSPLRTLSAYYVARKGDGHGPNADRMEVRDRFGVQTHCRLVSVTPEALADVNEISANGTRGAVRRRTEPRTETEERIARIWREVLALSNVSVDDTFFELGGDSLLALRVANRLRELFSVRVSLRDLFEMPTIAGLARVITQRQDNSDRIDPSDAAADASSSDAELLAMMNELPSEEVDALLKRVSEA